jgi:hypothetical protein
MMSMCARAFVKKHLPRDGSVHENQLKYLVAVSFRPVCYVSTAVCYFGTETASEFYMEGGSENHIILWMLPYC